jgi:nicotinate-nucleotide adenylyltransferase
MTPTTLPQARSPRSEATPLEAPESAGLLGVFGGTFNPIHLGHLHAARQVVAQLGLARLLFVPAGTPPHKRDERLAPARLRCEWVRLAVADEERLGVDDLEVERAGLSYSVDTLRAIGARVAPRLPVFVIGCDALAEMGSWREPETILELANLAVIARREPDAPDEGMLAARFPSALAGALEFDSRGLVARHRRSDTWVRWVEIDALPISSTDVRARIAAGLSVRDLLPAGVHDAVVGSGVYENHGVSA